MAQAMAARQRQGEAHLWLISLGLSLVCNVVLLAALGFYQLASLHLQLRKPEPQPVQETVLIYPEMLQKVVQETAVSAPAKRFAQTSPEQTSAKPEHAAFLGERNTTATSDRTPDAAAPPLPSQTGPEPLAEDVYQTTESDFQDGNPDLQAAAQASPTPPEPLTSQPTPPSDPSEPNGAPEANEELVSSLFPVDVQVPSDPSEAMPKPTPLEVTEDLPKSKAETTADPGFRSNQRKQAIVGSISRTGKSSLDVEDSELGRYQAAISRAVELEWQRNCIRHRDFITPGFLTARVLVESSGKVKSVTFEGEMKTSEIQKGFTLNSIRDAKIPAMPKALKREYASEPLELAFRFFF